MDHSVFNNNSGQGGFMSDVCGLCGATQSDTPHTGCESFHCTLQVGSLLLFWCTL